MNLTKQEKIARLRILRSDSIGATTFWNVIKSYGSATEAISNKSDLSRKFTQKIDLVSEEKVLEELMLLKKMGSRMVFLEDELYPPLLRNIPDPPPILTFYGNKDRLLQFYRRNTVSIVGSRNSSIHANKFCTHLAEELGRAGLVIVSGLARGIDAYAHKGSLESGTIAVLAGGIDVIYPQENTKLYEAIAEKGAIFTETPYGVSPQAQLFPRRNRIIAGMTYGTVVVEAAANSGSLITAKFALEYNREVFAVPGFPMDPRSIGGNSLLKQGAKLVQTAQDVIDEIERQSIACQRPLFEQDDCAVPPISQQNLEEIRETILKSLSFTPITVDELIASVKVPAQHVLAVLFELEIAGKIERSPGQHIFLSTS